jgi:predicted dehydrogenase
MGDNSWDIEFAEFLEEIRLGRQPAAGLADARAALEIVESIYRESNL